MRGADELDKSDRTGVVMRGPWAARGGGTADAAVRIERLEDKLERIEMLGETMKGHVSCLLESANQSSRFHALAESLRNAREYKVQELQKTLRDVRGRLDQIEGPKSQHAGLAHKSLPSLNERLAAMGRLEARMAAVERMARINLALFAGSLLVLGLAVAVRVF